MNTVNKTATGAAGKQIAPTKKAAQATKRTQRTKKPRGVGWEDPNQTWSPRWFIAFLLMLPIDILVAYLTRDWGIFQWVPGLALGMYTLEYLVYTFVPPRPDLRTPKQKAQDEEWARQEEEEEEPYTLRQGIGMGYVEPASTELTDW
jgi:hypothetical protein